MKGFRKPFLCCFLCIHLINILNIYLYLKNELVELENSLIEIEKKKKKKR